MADFRFNHLKYNSIFNSYAEFRSHGLPMRTDHLGVFGMTLEFIISLCLCLPFLLCSTEWLRGDYI